MLIGMTPLILNSFDPVINLGKLEDFSKQVVETLDRPLFIVIDDLDEWAEGSRSLLINLL